MGDFWQSGTITTIHRLPGKTTEDIEAALKRHSADRPVCNLARSTPPPSVMRWHHDSTPPDEWLTLLPEDRKLEPEDMLGDDRKLDPEDLLGEDDR